MPLVRTSTPTMGWLRFGRADMFQGKKRRPVKAPSRIKPSQGPAYQSMGVVGDHLDDVGNDESNMDLGDLKRWQAALDCQRLKKGRTLQL